MTTMVGQRIRRREDPRFLLGQGRYVDDTPAAGERHVVFVRSDWAHARLVAVDAEAARAFPGVEVFTAADLDLPVVTAPAGMPIPPEMGRPLLATDRVRFVGDIIAAVIADSPAAAVDAAELVAAELEPLPAVTDMRAAARDETLLHEATGTNTCLHIPPGQPDAARIEECEVIVRGSVESPRLLACPIEPRCTRARLGEDGRMTVHLSTQTPHQDRAEMAELLGLDPAALRLIAPDVGGGFGGKGLDVEDVLVAALARHTGRPLRWTETRSEHMVAMHHGRAQWIDFELGGDRDGRLRALRIAILQDAGAYPGIGAILATLTSLMASGVYSIERIEADVRAVVTNTTPTGPVRGAGRPEAAQMIERAIDQFAAELGMDPAEVRRRNMIPAAGPWPHVTAAGARYDIGDYPGALQRVLEAAGYEQLRAEQAARRAAEDPLALGIGLSVYVEVTNGISEAEFGAVEVTEEGAAILRTGSFSHGQGHETTFAQIVSERTGIPLEQITVIKGDTDEVLRGTGTYGSKSTQIGGAAAGQASELLVETAKRLAADQLEADPGDMTLDLQAGRFHVTGSPTPALSWGDLAGALAEAGRLAELRAETDFKPAQPTFPFGAHLAVVEVDTDTGQVRLRRMVAVDDAGTIINPMIAEGQVHGGLAAGIAQALFEEVRYDADGNPEHANLVTYAMPAATELPMFELAGMQTPTPVNPLGAKGIGESGTIGATPAVHNAVIDALAHLGVRHIGLPVNGERVWRAIEAARSA
jgi:carbon-monoxide dehydrogenase large subunit